MKPGNRVEGKTLRTREGRAERTLRGEPAACDGEHTSDPKEAVSGRSSLGVPMASLEHGKPWTRGGSDGGTEPRQRWLEEPENP